MIIQSILVGGGEGVRGVYQLYRDVDYQVYVGVKVSITPPYDGRISVWDAYFQSHDNGGGINPNGAADNFTRTVEYWQAPGSANTANFEIKFSSEGSIFGGGYLFYRSNDLSAFTFNAWHSMAQSITKGEFCYSKLTSNPVNQNIVITIREVSTQITVWEQKFVYNSTQPYPVEPPEYPPY
jgi:hypothetical protein